MASANKRFSAADVRRLLSDSEDDEIDVSDIKIEVITTPL